MSATWTLDIPKDKRGLSGSTLKIIAIITMIIDHTGATILGRYLMQAGVDQLTSQEMAIQWLQQNAILYLCYEIMRMIGRIAFPIYCFLLIEGFFHTRDVKKYAGRLLLFAVISEIPFNLALGSTICFAAHQNVFFELFAGLLTIWGLQQVKEKIHKKGLMILARVAVVFLGAVIAEITGMDYGAIGILCIVALYLLAPRKGFQILAGCLAFLWEFTAPLAFLPIAFYNGKRGLAMKYIFYIIYPAHLLILYLVSIVLGISGFSAL